MLTKEDVTHKLSARIPIMGDAELFGTEPDKGLIHLVIFSGMDQAIVTVQVVEVLNVERRK